MRRSDDSGSSDRRPTRAGPTTVTQGRTAESLAALYLQLVGFEILERNLRDGPRELDLIARDERWLVVVEVRSRGRSHFGRPEESVRRDKRRQLLRAGRSFWWRRTDHRRELRFDLIAISLERDGLWLRHHPHFLDPQSPLEPAPLR